MGVMGGAKAINLIGAAGELLHRLVAVINERRGIAERIALLIAWRKQCSIGLPISGASGRQRRGRLLLCLEQRTGC